ncbi:GNAT family N-acetyltransferase [Stenotrophomonas sp. STM01]|uniref:GNAT family N-acetyltransferase n=1 Tax=Stenotrophomonas sp. STM01 TaxID=2769278 RepID=UPI00177D9C3E|nr:GNAT family N-acetyltransferase [Stenotrophomonas sp. STM01]MBD9537654.1 GNAT family N-acetyltransferase [Stenotrophomonas sp. STM01]
MSIFDLRLETERLILRPPGRQDFEAFAAFCADPVAMQHLGGVQPKPVAWRSLAGLVGSWQLLGYSMFSVIEKDSGNWIGRVGPWQPYGWPGTEVGWSIVSSHWGRGYAPEAARAAIDWAFDALGWEEVIHTIAPDNSNSQHVARKLGARVLRNARLPPPHEVDVEVWGQSRQAWLAAR